MHRQSSRTRPSGTHRALSAIVLTAVILAAFDTPATDGSGGGASSQTPGTTNTAPSFGTASTVRSVAENTAAGRPIGSPVKATDPDPGETLVYRLEGTDSDPFGLVPATGQLRTRAPLNHEAMPSYSVVVVAEDSQGATATIQVTIAVTDRPEPPLAPDAPIVGSVLGSDTSLVVHWTAPEHRGKPAIESYDLRFKSEKEPWWEYRPKDIPDTTGRIERLTRNTTYEVQVRATNEEGDGPWSASGFGMTGRNTEPYFADRTTTRSVAENTPAGHNIGAPVAAVEPDWNDMLTYTLRGDDATAFDIDQSNGQLLTRAALDHETRSSYSVTVEARDRAGASDSIEVTIEVTDENEPPYFTDATTTRSVLENTPAGRTIGVPVAAMDPDMDDAPTYGLSGEDAAAFNIVESSGQLLTRTALDHEAKASYSVTVEARDRAGASDSIEVTIEVTNENEPPSFAATYTTRSVPENTGPGQAFGDRVTAKEPDRDDTPTYSLGGEDAAAFDIVESSGQLLTRAALDHEARSSYSVTVEARDRAGAGDSIEVTIAVTDQDEPPDAPAAPTFPSMTDKSVTVSWTAPSTAGRPDIMSYDLRYRAASDTSFTDGPQDVTGTTATISDLGPNTVYRVQVRATNDEGDSPWSAPGTTVTINDEALQKAWLAHFGRTVAGQVVNAVSARLGGDGSAPVTADGVNLRLPSGTREAPEQLAQVWPDHRAQDRGAAFGTTGMSELGLAPGSGFHLSSNPGPEGSHVLTAWGRYASDSFQSADETLELDGEVRTAVLGADAEWDRWLAGVALSFSDGEGEFEPGHTASPGKGSGTLDSTLNSIHPYLRYEMKEGLSVWGLAGYGSGHLTQTDDGARPIDTDIRMRMGALGTRSELLSAPAGSGLGLALKADALWMEMESEAVEEPDGRGLKRARAKSTRLRLLLEGSQSYELDSGARLTPTLETGLRSDGGDAESGSGVEVRAGIRYTAPGMTVEASAHSLFGHQRRDYEEWGASGSIRIVPDASGRGVSLTVAPSWGTVASGTDRLWTIPDARHLAPNRDFEPGGRLEAEIGYGVGMSGGRGVVTPYTGLSLSNDDERTYRLGGRWNVGPAFRESTWRAIAASMPTTVRPSTL